MRKIYFSASFALLTMLGCSNGTVTSVKIEEIKDAKMSSPNIYLGGIPIETIGFSGSTLKLKATVEGTGKFDSTVTWALQGGPSGSKISENGILNIAPQINRKNNKGTVENFLDTLVVTATSKQNKKILESLVFTIVHDANAYIGKWVTDLDKFKDTLIIEENSYTYKMKNGNSLSMTPTKWKITGSPGDEFLSGDYPIGGYLIVGKVNNIQGTIIYNLYGTVSFAKGETTEWSFHINKEKSKLCLGWAGPGYLTFNRVK